MGMGMGMEMGMEMALPQWACNNPVAPARFWSLFTPGARRA